MTKPKLLHVEDNPADGLLLELCLAQVGSPFDIVRAADGELADSLFVLACVTSPFPFQLVVLDIWLPRLDGLELLKRLYQLHEFDHVPIVIMTSSTSLRDREYASRFKPAAFIQKPVDYSDMIDVGARLASYILPLTG